MLLYIRIIQEFSHRTWCRCSARKLKLPTPRLSLCGSNDHSSLAKVSTSFNIRSTNFVTNVHSFKYALVQHPECILLITEMCCSFPLDVNLIRCWLSGNCPNSQSKFAWSKSHTCNCYQIEKASKQYCGRQTRLGTNFSDNNEGFDAQFHPELSLYSKFCTYK